MKLEKWALIAEIVGAFAIVITLIMLIVEIRANTEATFAANRQSIANRAENLLYQQMDPVVARVLNKVDNDSPLDQEEATIYFGWLNARLRGAEEAYLQYLDGHLSEDYWQTRAVAAVASMRSPYAREVFARVDFSYTRPFREWLTEALAEEYSE